MKDSDKFPVLYSELNECCGCELCVLLCPVHAIDMKEDNEGFRYPVIIQNKCIRCLICENACVNRSSEGN